MSKSHVKPSSRVRLAIAGYLCAAAVLLGINAGGQERYPNSLSDEELAALIKKATGQRVSITRSEHFRVIALDDAAGSRDDHDARRLLGVAEEVHDEFRALVGKQHEEGFSLWPGVADFYFTSDGTQYGQIVERLIPKYGCDQQRVAFWRDAGGRMWMARPPVSVAVSLMAPGPNVVANHAMRFLVGNWRCSGGPTRDWLSEGMAYASELEKAGSISALAMGRASAGGSTAASVADYRVWGREVRQQVDLKLHEPVRRLTRVPSRAMNAIDRKQCWALVTFLKGVGGGRFERFMRMLGSTSGVNIELRVAYGWTEREADCAWEAWIRGWDLGLRDEELAERIEIAVGVRPTIVRSENFRVATMFDASEARALLVLAEEAHAAFCALVGKPRDHKFWGDPADEFLISPVRREELVAGVLQPYRQSLLEFDNLRGSEHGRALPHGRAGVCIRGRDEARSTVVDHASRYLFAVFADKRGQSPGFLREGWAHHMGFELTGCTPGGIVGAPGWSARELGPRRLVAWRERVQQIVKERKELPYRELESKQFAVDFDEDSRVQSWSMVEFLMREHRNRFGVLLHVLHESNFEFALRESFGWTGEDYCRAWTSWCQSGS